MTAIKCVSTRTGTLSDLSVTTQLSKKTTALQLQYGQYGYR